MSVKRTHGPILLAVLICVASCVDEDMRAASPPEGAAGEQLRLYVATIPEDARVEGEEDGMFRELEQLETPFLLDESASRPGRRVYSVPESWRDRVLRVRAVPTDTQGKVGYEPSPAIDVELRPDAAGAPPMVVLALPKTIPLSGVSEEEAVFIRAQRTYRVAQGEADPVKRYRQYEMARTLLASSDHGFAAPVIGAIDADLEELRPEAGRAVLEAEIRRATAPAETQGYLEAYDRLVVLEGGTEELREFEVGAEAIRARVRDVRGKLLEEWKHWADARRKAEADKRLETGDRSLERGQPWQGWRQAFEASILLGEETEEILGLMDRACGNALGGLLQGPVTLDMLVENRAYGILIRLVQGSGMMVEALRGTLEARHNLDPDGLEKHLETDEADFWEAHTEWFPPEGS